MFNSCLAPRQMGQSLLDVVPGFQTLSVDAVNEGLSAIATLLWHDPAEFEWKPRKLTRKARPSVRPSTSTPTKPPEFRTDSGPDLLPVFLTGRAAPCWTPTECGRHIGFTPTALAAAAERIQSGQQPCFLQWEHNTGIELATVAAGTLDVFFQRCQEAGFDGFGFRARLRNDATGRAVLRHVASGKFGVSLGFVNHGPSLRGGVDLKESTDVFELSIVDAPAFGAAAAIRLGWFVGEDEQLKILFGRD